MCSGVSQVAPCVCNAAETIVNARKSMLRAGCYDIKGSRVIGKTFKKCAEWRPVGCDALCIIQIILPAALMILRQGGGKMPGNQPIAEQRAFGNIQIPHSIGDTGECRHRRVKRPVCGAAKAVQ